MKEPEPGSAFLGMGDEDARPNASEYLRRRAEQDRRASAARWSLTGAMLAGASLVSSVAVGVGVGWGGWPASFGLSLACGVAGILAGAFVAVCSWAFLVQESRTPGPFKPGLVEENSWDGMSVWIAAWSAIGVVVGAGLGASRGALWTFPDARPDPWAYLGAAAGLLLAVATWLPLSRRP